MADNFTRHSFEKVINIEKIITIFYMELSKSFAYEGEKHDFWEMVYIDKGEMLCTADKNRFILKSGEMTFHKPNEFHNLSGNNDVAPNVSIITFECHSRAMRYFEGKIFKLESSPYGSNQMTKNLLEVFLIRLCRHTDVLTKKMRKHRQSPVCAVL